MSHCERKNTSSSPINSANWPPPQVDVSVGPIGAPTWQSQNAIISEIGTEKTDNILLNHLENEYWNSRFAYSDFSLFYSNHRHSDWTNTLE